LTGHLVQSYALSFIFALGTLNGFYMSGELWTHGGVELMLLVALLWVKKAEQEKDDLWLGIAGLPLAFAYVVRPTAIIFLLAFSAYTAFFHRRSFPWFAASAGVVLIVFSLWSYRVYGQFLPSYYRASRLALDETFWEALVGQSFSPNRGLFVFTPLFLFSVYGAYLAFKAQDRFLRFTAVLLAPYFLATATFGHWWGGFSYGPRLFLDVIPLLVTLLVFPVKRVDLSFRSRRLYTALFLLAFGFSLFVGQRALYDPGPHEWNADPVSVDRRPERIWDWTDWQIFR
jgi:hypothetical protein